MRLTRRRTGDGKHGYWSEAKREDMIQRLGQFEDLGLDPEALKGMMQEYAEMQELLASAQGALAARFPALMWIPVEEALPVDDEQKLVTCRNAKGLLSWNRAYYDGRFWHGSGSMSGVIAWADVPRYLPQVKKEEER